MRSPGSHLRTLAGPLPAACAVLLALASGTSACRSTATDADAAVGVVQRFFAALPAADCGALGPLLAPDTQGRPCDEVVAEMNAHELRLLEIASAVPDGRDRDAILVRAQLSQDGKPLKQPAVLRVVRHDGAWRLRP